MLLLDTCGTLMVPAILEYQDIMKKQASEPAL